MNAIPLNGAYSLEENQLGFKSLLARFEGDQLVLDMDTVEGSFSLPVGIGKWLETDFIRSTRYGPPEKSRAFVSGAWESPDILNVSFVFESRCQMLRLKISFGEEIMIEPSVNVSFGPFDVPVIRGRQIR